MNSHHKADSADKGRSPMLWPFIISFTGHMLFFGILLFHPGENSNSSFIPSVIDVQMVETPPGAPVSEPVRENDSEAAPVLEKSPREKPEPVPDTADASAQQAEVSVAPSKPEMKTALKYKTFKSEKVLKNTLDNLAKKIESSPPKPIEDAIKRLREQVAQQQRPGSNQAGEEGAAEGKQKGYAVGSRQEGEAIDIYRLEVAYAVNRNWAFAEQLAGGEHLVASVVFKIMPDGRIEDIFFTDRSGNAHLDDSAMKAIVKTSPVKPHPPGINRAFIELGLRFTPKGVQ